MNLTWARRLAFNYRVQQPLCACAAGRPRLLATPSAVLRTTVRKESAGSEMSVSLSANDFPTQTFAGSPLDRSAACPPRLLLDRPSDCVVTFVCGRQLCVAQRGDGGQGTAILWLSPTDAEEIAGVTFNDENEACDKLTQEPFTLIHLGRGKEDTVHRLALALPAKVMQQQATMERLSVRGAAMKDTRQMLPLLGAQDVAIAGLAVALAGWHEAHLFCGRCGASTASIQNGAKRVCSANPRHRLYPRTDPVVIMVVEDVEGRRILLGRRAKGKPGQFTALSGFVDAGESIEEAVCREVMEESGLEVNSVSTTGSQPWPIGRAGSNELMIGCCARATHNDHSANPSEMEEVQWFSPEELRAALANSLRPENPYAGGQGVIEDGNGAEQVLWVPPPYAIAHHLIGAWVASKTSEGDNDGAARL